MYSLYSFTQFNNNNNINNNDVNSTLTSNDLAGPNGSSLQYEEDINLKSTTAQYKSSTWT